MRRKPAVAPYTCKNSRSRRRSQAPGVDPKRAVGFQARFARPEEPLSAENDATIMIQQHITEFAIHADLLAAEGDELLATRRAADFNQQRWRGRDVGIVRQHQVCS